MARGLKTGGGSRKGRPNKITANLKDAILHAFDELGGKSYLVEVARTNPQVFCTLLGKVPPSQVDAKVEGRLTLVQLIASTYPASEQ